MVLNSKYKYFCRPKLKIKVIHKKIKGSHITNLTDARYFAAWGAEWLGFCLDINAEKYISPDKIIEIKEWVDGAKITLEFGNQSLDEIQAIVEKIKPHTIEIPIENFTSQYFDLNVEMILRIDSIASMTSILVNESVYFLIDFSKLHLSWEKIKANPELLNLIISLSKQVNLILDINFSKENIEEIIEKIPFYAMNLKGGEEEKVGFKSFEILDDILEILEE